MTFLEWFAMGSGWMLFALQYLRTKQTHQINVGLGIIIDELIHDLPEDERLVTHKRVQGLVNGS